MAKKRTKRKSHRKEPVECVYVTSVHVTDPDTGAAVEVEIWKDPESGSLFGIDATFVEQVDHLIVSPFNRGTKLSLSEAALEATLRGTLPRV